MIATTNQFSFSVSNSVAEKALSQRPRRITRELGRALEKLSHAIDYVTDEHVLRNDSGTGSNHSLEAVQMLIALRLRVYLDGPEVQTIGERFRMVLKQLLDGPKQA